MQWLPLHENMVTVEGNWNQQINGKGQYDIILSSPATPTQIGYCSTDYGVSIVTVQHAAKCQDQRFYF